MTAVTVLGIDTSHHNALPDFAALKRGGIGLILPKATEGIGFVDPQYAASRAGAHAAGMLVGPYHFARPGDPAAQADYFLAHATPRAGELTELDMEDTTIPDPVGFSVAWCRRVIARVGGLPFMYLNSWFLGHYDWTPVKALGCPLWLAKYDGAPTGGPTGVWPVIAVKQFTDRATVPGQPGQVDEDAFAGDLATLARYAIPGAPMPPAQEDDLTPEEHTILMSIAGAVGEMRGEMQNVTPAVGRIDQRTYALLAKQTDPATLSAAIAADLVALLPQGSTPPTDDQVLNALRTLLGIPTAGTPAAGS